MSKRMDWVHDYAAWIMRYSDADEAFATMCAEASAKMQQELNGDNVNEWEPPRDCAEDELSCWYGDDA